MSDLIRQFTKERDRIENEDREEDTVGLVPDFSLMNGFGR